MVSPSSAALVDLYRETHIDFFTSQPIPSSTHAQVSPLSLPYDACAALYNPNTSDSEEENYPGGGSSASKSRNVNESEEPSCIVDCPEALVWKGNKVATTSQSSKIAPEASYTFVRELKRSVATDDKTVSSVQFLLHLGSFHR